MTRVLMEKSRLEIRDDLAVISQHLEDRSVNAEVERLDIKTKGWNEPELTCFIETKHPFKKTTPISIKRI